MTVDTPCIAVCQIDPVSRLCFGCGRTLPEIARWGRMSREERLAIMTGLPDRLANAGLARATSKEAAAR